MPSGACQGSGWILGVRVLMGGSYTVKAVQTQVSLRGAAGREVWLGVALHRAGGRGQVTGWMESSELQRRAAGDADGLARLRGGAREGWSVEECRWVSSRQPCSTGHGLRGAGGGLVPASAGGGREADEEGGGVSVVVLMRRVAVGRTAGGVEQAVGIRCRREWYKHKMSREQLVGMTGQRVQADGGREVLVEGQEVWEEWTGQQWRTQSGGGRARGSGGQRSKQ